MKTFLYILILLFSNTCFAAASGEEIIEGSLTQALKEMRASAPSEEPSTLASYVLPEEVTLPLEFIEKLFKARYAWTHSFHTPICLRRCLVLDECIYDLTAVIDTFFNYYTYGEAVTALQKKAKEEGVKEIVLKWNDRRKEYSFSALKLTFRVTPYTEEIEDGDDF